MSNNAISIDNAFMEAEEDSQIFLDAICDKFGEDFINMSAYLDISPADLQNSRSAYRNNDHEYRFHILWKWYLKCEEHTRKKDFTNALEECNRKDLIEFRIDKSSYRYELKEENVSLEKEVCAKDFIKVSSLIPSSYQRVARFLQIPESKINSEIQNAHDGTTEITYRLLTFGMFSERLKTRQQLCDSLLYVDSKEYAEKLVKYWAKLK